VTGGLLDEVAEHRLAEFEVGDDTVFDGANGGDGIGGTSEHLSGELADGSSLSQDAAGPFLESNDGGFIDDNTFPVDGHDCVGRSEVDCQIGAEPAPKSLNHP